MHVESHSSISPESGPLRQDSIEALRLMQWPIEAYEVQSYEVESFIKATSEDLTALVKRVSPTKPAATDGDSTGRLISEIAGWGQLEEEDEFFLGEVIAMGQSIRARYSNEPFTSEEQEIFDHALSEAEIAKDVFYHTNLALVVDRAKAIPRPEGVEITEAVAEGTFGLSAAIDRFDHTRGYKFSTYAYKYIEEAIKRGINKSRPIAIPRYAQNSAASEAWLRAKGTDVEQLTRNVERAKRIGSLQEPVGDDNTATLQDFIPDRNTSVEDEATTAAILEGVKRVANMYLTGRRQRSYLQRYGLIDGAQMSVREIAAQEGVTEAAIKMHLKKAKEILEPHLEQFREML